MVIVDFKEKKAFNVAKNGQIVGENSENVEFVNVVEVTGVVVFNDEVELVTAKEEAKSALQMAISSNAVDSFQIARETDEFLKLKGHNSECFVSSLANKMIPVNVKQTENFDDEKSI